jgi:formylglycine-generating enzyme required for sulfatase activity/serine/threonine protein kinase
MNEPGAAPQAIGSYRILERLGSGGFGEVWLGEDPVVGRRVAVKVFRPLDDNLIAFATSSSEEALEVLRRRFLEEARILADLEDSPHVVSVLTFGTLADGTPWYAMPFLSRSLRDEIGEDVFDVAAFRELEAGRRPRAVPPERAFVWLEQLLQGLASAHARGLVHRDVKPSNVLLTADEQVRLADFGIAKAPDGQHSTLTNLAMGARNYMAPEQRESAKHVDARADVYSTAVIAYRMLTGRLPSGRFADPSVHQPAVPHALDALLLEALSEDRAGRPADARAFLARFRTAVAESGSQNGASSDESNTWAAGDSAPDVSPELRPLRDRIEALLVEHGEIPDEEWLTLEDLGGIAGLDRASVETLVAQEEERLRVRVTPIRRFLQRVDARLREYGAPLPEPVLHALTEAAEQLDWDGTRVAAVVERRVSAAAGAEGSTRASESETEERVATGSRRRRPAAAVVAIVLAMAGAGLSPPGRHALDALFGPKRSPVPGGEVEDVQEEGSVGTVSTGTDVLGTRLYLDGPPEPVEASGNARPEDSVGTVNTGADVPGTRLPVDGPPVPGTRLPVDGPPKPARGPADTPEDRSDGTRAAGSGPETVAIPGGTFRMGCVSGRDCEDDEKPARTVRIASFRMTRHEITVSQFRAFVEATDYRTEAERDVGAQGCAIHNGSEWQWDGERDWRSPGFEQGPAHPVVCVSWNDAVAYAEWLSDRTGERWRLPTESEWEYAARSGSETAYHFGNDPEGLCRYGNVWDASAGRQFNWTGTASCDDGYAWTAPVGSFVSNGFGLHDMNGNVREWTADCWHESYAGGPSDGRAWGQEGGGDCSRRVLRSGSWFSIPRSARSAYRYWATAGNRDDGRGFRLVQDAR